MFFDSHAHYYDKRFKSDLSALLGTMNENGVSNILACPSDVPSSEWSLKLAEKNDYIYAAVGIHPHDAKSYTADASDALRKLAAHPKCVAIGETGLDYALNLSPREKQIEIFKMQLSLARELDKPVIIHDRDAHKDTFDMLSSAGCRGVIHCYSGSVEMALELVKMGYYISFTGVITFSNARKLLDVIRALPLDRLMIETDAPYLTPEPFRGRRNDSTFVRLTCEKMAEVRDLPLAEMAKITSDNAKACFGIAK